MSLADDYLVRLLPSLDDVADPFDVYKRLLDGPPLRSADSRAIVLSRYDDCVAALRHPQVSNDRAVSPLSPRPTASAMVFNDPPTHTRIRGLVTKAFTRGRIERLRPWFEEEVDRRIDTAVRRGRMDVVSDFALPLPVAAISQLLGIPPEDREVFRQWSSVIVSNFDEILRDLSREQQRERRRALREFRGYLLGLADRRRREPRDDLFTGLVLAEEQGDRLSSQELVRNVQLLLGAGHETTVSAISSGALMLIERPDMRERVAADPEYAADFVEEVLRRFAPVQITLRFAGDDLRIGDEELAKGTLIFIMYAAANLDPRKFPEPWHFDPSRHGGRHIAFGGGIHYCLGASLARMEGTVALRKLASATGEARVGADGVRYRESVVMRQLASFPLELNRMNVPEAVGV
jgi:cytochrome P450